MLLSHYFLNLNHLQLLYQHLGSTVCFSSGTVTFFITDPYLKWIYNLAVKMCSGLKLDIYSFSPAAHFCFTFLRYRREKS